MAYEGGSFEGRPNFKRLKTTNAKVQNKDLVEHHTNKMPYGWLSSYNQRALLVRILMNKKKAIQMPQDTNKLKFYTRDSSSPMYTCGKALDMDWEELIEHTKQGVKGFEYFQNIDDSWEEINSCLRKGDFKYKADESGLYTWTSTDMRQEVDKLSDEQQKYVTFFQNAMLCNMSKGEGKDWLVHLVNFMTNCGDLPSHVFSTAPSPHSRSNTTLEMVYFADESIDADDVFSSPITEIALASPPPSNSLSQFSFEEDPFGQVFRRRRNIVPDVTCCLRDFPGMFPIVFEIQPAYQDAPGLTQNYQQMLSKMFFQDVIFGIVITPISFHLSVLFKKNSILHLYRTKEMLTTYQDCVGILNLGKLNSLCAFIYSALKWSLKSKCLLENEMTPGCSFSGDS